MPLQLQLQKQWKQNALKGPLGWPGDPTLQLCRRRARRGASFPCLVRPEACRPRGSCL